MLDQSVLSNIFTTFGLLFSITNPFGVVPIFLGLMNYGLQLIEVFNEASLLLLVTTPILYYKFN